MLSLKMFGFSKFELIRKILFRVSQKNITWRKNVKKYFANYIVTPYFKLSWIFKIKICFNTFAVNTYILNRFNCLKGRREIMIEIVIYKWQKIDKCNLSPMDNKCNFLGHPVPMCHKISIKSQWQRLSKERRSRPISTIFFLKTNEWCSAM